MLFFHFQGKRKGFHKYVYPKARYNALQSSNHSIGFNSTATQRGIGTKSFIKAPQWHNFSMTRKEKQIKTEHRRNNKSTPHEKQLTTGLVYSCTVKHTAKAATFMHQVKCLVDLSKCQIVCDVLIHLNFLQQLAIKCLELLLSPQFVDAS